MEKWGGEKPGQHGRERETSLHYLPYTPQATEPSSPACAQTGNRTQLDPVTFPLLEHAQSIEPHQSGHTQ